jgi:hypothetical protein
LNGATQTEISDDFWHLDGGIAQLGERLHGMQEVSGSIPLTSTNSGGARFKLAKISVPFV